MRGNRAADVVTGEDGVLHKHDAAVSNAPAGRVKEASTMIIGDGAALQEHDADVRMPAFPSSIATF